MIDVNREHGITSKAYEFGSAAISKASELDQRYEVTSTVKAAGSEAYKRLSTFDQEYKVSEKISAGFASLTNLLKPRNSSSDY